MLLCTVSSTAWKAGVGKDTALASYATPVQTHLPYLSTPIPQVLTVGKYVTPNGTDIDREGIQPDFGRAPGPLDASRVLDACRVVRQEHGL